LDIGKYLKRISKLIWFLPLRFSCDCVVAEKVGVRQWPFGRGRRWGGVGYDDGRTVRLHMG
jgi:hypothetical protein